MQSLQTLSSRGGDAIHPVLQVKRGWLVRLLISYNKESFFQMAKSSIETWCPECQLCKIRL
jgi:hypothetical protein